MREYFVWLAKFITIVLVFIIGIPVMIGILAGMAEVVGKASISKDKEHTIAVIQLRGEIMDSKEVVEQLYKQVDNDEVKGIVLHIDSPGGAVGPSQDIYDTVKKLKVKKPIVVSMGSVAASGGLYSALGASKIYAQPGTLTGSIGVIFQIPNFSKIAEKFGVDVVTIKSGKLKDIGNMFRDMTPEEKTFLDETVHKVHDVFIDAVAESRNIPRETVTQFADGRIIIGTDAKKLSLVDEFGDVYAAARAVFDILGKPLTAGEDVRLIYPGDKFAELREFLKEASDLPRMLNPMKPKAEIKYLMY